MKYTKEEMEHMLEYARKYYLYNMKFTSTYDNRGILTISSDF